MKFSKFFLCLFTFVFLSACTSTTPVLTATIAPTLSPTTTIQVPTPTATIVPLNVSPDVKMTLDNEHVLTSDGKMNTTLLHSVTAKNVTIIPESITVTASNDTSVSEIITGKDASGANYIWNAEANGWVLDFMVDTDYTKPADAPFLERSGFTDGSANFIVTLYYAEHPELISENAIMPYYKLRVDGSTNGTWWYILTLYRSNQYQWKDPQETMLYFKKTEAPYGFVGLIRSADSQGREIDVICQVRRNPKNGNVNSKQTINIFFGLDKTSYDFYTNFNGTGFNEITQTISNFDTELVAVFPPPPNTVGYDPSQFTYKTQQRNPAVMTMVDPSEINMFTSVEQQALRKIFNDIVAGNNYNDTPQTPASVSITELPRQLSHMIVLTGFDGWAMQPQ